MITGSNVMKRWMVIFILTAMPVFAQTNTGELRLKVVDPQGLAAKTSVELRCDANQYQAVFSSDESGERSGQAIALRAI